MKLTPEERKEYEAFVNRLRRIASHQHTEMVDAKDSIKERKDLIEKAKKEAKEEQITEFVIELWKLNIPTENIAVATKLDVQKVEAIIENYKNKKGR